jgi:hypothetical protein
VSIRVVNIMARKLYGNELHPVYSRWRSTLGRCTDPKHASYKNYGGRGITLAPELREFLDYRNYVCSLLNYDPVNLTLDRIDNNKGYEKGNLRWVSTNVQVANQRYSGKGFNKYTGVNWNVCKKRWIARLTLNGKTLLSKSYLTEQEAVEARNAFIKENSLPHVVQEWSN